MKFSKDNYKSFLKGGIIGGLIGLLLCSFIIQNPDFGVLELVKKTVITVLFLFLFCGIIGLITSFLPYKNWLRGGIISSVLVVILWNVSPLLLIIEKKIEALEVTESALSFFVFFSLLLAIPVFFVGALIGLLVSSKQKPWLKGGEICLLSLVSFVVLMSLWGIAVEGLRDSCTEMCGASGAFVALLIIYSPFFFYENLIFVSPVFYFLIGAIVGQVLSKI